MAANEIGDHSPIQIESRQYTTGSAKVHNCSRRIDHGGCGRTVRHVRGLCPLIKFAGCDRVATSSPSPVSSAAAATTTTATTIFTR